MSNAPIQLGNSPTSWGVDFPDAAENPPWQQVLDGIVAAGYAVTELGPVGYLPDDPKQVGEELRERGLTVAGSFVFQPFHDPNALDRVLGVVRATCALISAVGGRYLVVIDEVSSARAETAGRSGDAPRLEGAARDRFLDAVRSGAAIAVEEFGLRPVLHNHAGTYLEYPDEIEAALEQVEADLLGLCIDTGHAAYAGIDPANFFETHHERVEYFHFKDIDRDVHAKTLAEPLDFWSAIAAGIFCPLGSGIVDFARLADVLRGHGFDGWATVEQDRDADSGSPVDDAIASRTYLEQIGMANHGGSSG